jgi:hypothetical protein
VAELPVRADFEHGVLVDAGELSVEGGRVQRTELAYTGLGRTSIRLEAGAQPVRALLIGGAPLREQILMWWNFVGRNHEEVVGYRAQWQRESGAEPADAPDASSGPADQAAASALPRRFGESDHHFAGNPLPAPVLPGVRLRPRD